MRQIQPLHLKQKYYKDIESEINKIFYELIYAPLLLALKGEKVSLINSINEKSSLVKAVDSGRVWFDNGSFYGEFNAKISRDLRDIGAKYNKHTKSWSYTGVVPTNVATAQVQAVAKYDKARQSILTTLDTVSLREVESISDTPIEYGKTIEMMEADFQKTIKKITISPTLTDEAMIKISKEWGKNLDLYIKEWTDENIFKLRTAVTENTFKGNRSTSLIKYIEDNYSVSRRKAKFLARQETSLLMGKFRETRYKSIGANKYRWSGAMDSRERDDHKALEGNVYTWDTPPIVNIKTGARGHPAEDFGCRCVAVALIE